MVWGDDKILGTPSSVSVEVNMNGEITQLRSWASGLDKSRNDDQLYVLNVDNPNKAIEWLNNQASQESLGIIYADTTNPRPFADTLNENPPGLEGGPMDVYVSFGEHYAFA